jgi:Uma2 family endonuclease
MYTPQKSELIDGVIVVTLDKKRRHVRGNKRIANWARQHFGDDYMQTQDPILIDEFNEPEPDVCVLAQPDYLETPLASDVVLVIEVGDSTIREDTTIKASLYARAGIQEYWVLDVANARLVVFREPQETGYRSVMYYVAGESVSP